MFMTTHAVAFLLEDARVQLRDELWCARRAAKAVELIRPAGSILGKTEAWVQDPSKFILFMEPPAKPHACLCEPPPVACCSSIMMAGVPLFPPKWYQWHRNRGKTIFEDPRLAPPLFWSPVLFLDGHGAFLDFSKSLRTNPYYPFEETREWAWYKPDPEDELQKKEK